MGTNDDIDALRFEDQLDSFLKGKMTPTEEQEFKTLLLRRPDLRQKAVATARLAKAIQSVGNEHDRATITGLNAITEREAGPLSETIVHDKKPRAKKRSVRRFIISFSCAASILLCLFCGYKYYKYTQITSLGQEFLAYFPPSEFTRGEDDTTADRLSILYDNLDDKKDLDDTIAELSRMWKASLSETYNDYTEYMPLLGWMLANAYLIDNDKNKALEVLDILIANYPADTALGSHARSLKNRLLEL